MRSLRYQVPAWPFPEPCFQSSGCKCPKPGYAVHGICVTVWLLSLHPSDQGSAQNFDELGSAAYGRMGRVLIYCTVYMAIFGAPMLLHLTAAESESAMFQALVCCSILPLETARVGLML